MSDVDMLHRFAEAWNRHDLDALMTFMAPDSVFLGARGADARGREWRGSEEVRKGFALVFETFPDAQFREARHFVAGDRGASHWRFEATRAADGQRIAANGCDLFTFRNGKIVVKDSYMKQVS